MNRRAFLRNGVLAVTGAAMLPSAKSAESSEHKPLFSRVGIGASLDNAGQLKAAGAQFLTVGVDSVLVPDKDEAAFEVLRARVKSSPLPVLACNGFIRPAHLHCVGAEANHHEVLKWAETCFKRLNQIGGKFIVFGSSGARRLKDGWPEDKADEQFVELLKKFGPLAEASDGTVVVEQLRTEECNYINHLAHAARLIRAAAHPRVRVLADLYHMASVGDSPKDLAEAMDVVIHVEIAEKKSRTVPGVAGDDFRPFFKVLREHGYNGALNIEGKWKPEQIAPAFKEIARQADEA